MCLAASEAAAKSGRCVLEVKGRKFLNGPCEIMISDPQGSFTIGVSETRPSKYFAYVSIEDGVAQGYWNETPDSTHAHTSLGILKRDGACWKSKTARICAYK